MGFSFIFGFDPVLVWDFFDVFWVSIGFCWVFRGHHVGKV